MPNSINRRTFIKSASALAGLTLMPGGLPGTSLSVTAAQVTQPKFKGISIHIGVNRVEPAYYHGQRFPELTAPENDAKEMYKIAQDMQFSAMTPILSERATKDRVVRAIETAAERLAPEGILFISYSGHGLSVFDDSGDEKDIKSEDTHDEAWVLYDGPLLDDQLYALWKTFDKVADRRILVVSDSCFSGTITRLFAPQISSAGSQTTFMPEGTIKAIPADVAKKIYEGDRYYFDAIQQKYGKAENEDLRTQLLLLSACQDGEPGQYAIDGPILSLFTACLLDVWQEGAFPGTYSQFYDQIVLAMKNRVEPFIQKPNFFPSATTRFGHLEKPFSI